ncbi:uncharacterized protein [Lolium perenne]|jgi:hypothetical protein|uniref:uncharacterized protein n=1 Tax=Lolium perenne TaxID=4522 RepID=UPI0021EAD233|nr:protein GL2-INTERACTING REPRESSOR 1-like [Lolium perenne]XP_051217057.1 protein GL2-INTERACTING REPRESSOR 1-like [Lolium perenne]
MSRANGGRGARRLDLKLNLSLPARGDSSSASRRILAAPADEESSPSSCVSSESEQHGGGGALQWSDSPEATSMVLAACPRCFIYVMLAEADPRCPKCRSPVILDFLHGGSGSGNGNGNEDDESNNRNRRGRRNRKE